MEKAEEKSGNEVHRVESCLLPFHVDHKFPVQSRADTEIKTLVDPLVLKQDQSDAIKTRRNLPSRRVANTSKLHISPKSGRLNSQPTPAEDVVEHSRENWDGKVTNSSGNSVVGTKMSEVTQKRCKNVIFKVQRKLDKEGQQIVPLLTDLWKRIENSGFISGAGNHLLDLRKIEQRIERLEYSGVMDLVCDVQFMLKSAMQVFGFSHEVRTEARKVHDLFLDCLKKSFPDSDFHEARNALSFSTPASTSSSAPATRQQQASGQGKRQKPVIEVETDIGTTRKSMLRGSMPAGEDTRARIPAPQKDARMGSGSGSSREQNQQDSPLHPGELVICKKKRKDRDKSVVKSRAGSGGPVSPPSMGRSIVSPGGGSISKDGKMVQQNTHPQGWGNQPQPANVSGGGGVAWAHPVKRLRTDTGKRRPSHL